LPIFYQLADICPEINTLQIASGKTNIEKWKVRAEYEKHLKEKEDKLNQKLEAIRKDEEKLASIEEASGN